MRRHFLLHLEKDGGPKTGNDQGNSIIFHRETRNLDQGLVGRGEAERFAPHPTRGCIRPCPHLHSRVFWRFVGGRGPPAAHLAHRAQLGCLAHLRTLIVCITVSHFVTTGHRLGNRRSGDTMEKGWHLPDWEEPSLRDSTK